MAQHVNAVSIAWHVARAIREAGWTGEIVAVHPQSCYLAGEDAAIYAIVRQPLGNGPLSLVIPASPEPSFEGLAAGASAASTGARLLLGDRLEVGLEHAVLWDPKAYLALGADPAGLQRGLAELYRVLSERAPEQSLARLLPYLHDEDLPTPLGAIEHFPRSHALIGGLIESLARRNRQSLKVVTSSLAGLGPGLTPSGDDFLAGVLLALALMRDHRADAELTEIAALLLETTAPRTHEISAAFLRAAHAGEASEPWHPLLDALSIGDAGRVRAAAVSVMEIGETSGADMLAGFLATIGTIHGDAAAIWLNAPDAMVSSHRRPPAETLPPTG
jgi:hypothetical protein